MRRLSWRLLFNALRSLDSRIETSTLALLIPECSGPTIPSNVLMLASRPGAVEDSEGGLFGGVTFPCNRQQRMELVGLGEDGSFFGGLATANAGAAPAGLFQRNAPHGGLGPFFDLVF